MADRLSPSTTMKSAEANFRAGNDDADGRLQPACPPLTSNEATYCVSFACPQQRTDEGIRE
jgi:hypothetical protein